MHFLITGGTGFIGTNFINTLDKSQHSITVLTRNIENESSHYRTINSLTEIHDNEKIDVVINLAGSPIARRWSDSIKTQLINSRVSTTQSLVELIKRLNSKPNVMINASAIGYYGNQGDTVLNETSSPVDCFTHEICCQWEQEANKVNELGVRLCIIRLGVVLGKHGGALEKMLLPFKLGLGGKLGNGKQFFSWVHINDVISAIMHLINNQNSHGIYNLTSPNAVTNAEFTAQLGAALSRPTICTMPASVVKLLYGEMGEALLLDGNRVVPQRLLSEDFKFKWPSIDNALNTITGS